MSRAATQGAAWTALQLWGVNAGGFVVFLILGRLLRPADFGVVAAAYTVTTLLRVIVDAGFTRYLVQRRDLPLIFADTAFWTAVTAALGFTAITMATAPLFADLFGIPRLTLVIRVMSALFILTALDATPVCGEERAVNRALLPPGGLPGLVERLKTALAGEGLTLAGLAECP